MARTRTKNPESLTLDCVGAAQIAGVGVCSIRGAIAEGSLPARRLGRRVLILRDDLLAWLRSLPPA